jgi:hypothetical protein
MTLLLHLTIHALVVSLCLAFSLHVVSGHPLTAWQSLVLLGGLAAYAVITGDWEWRTRPRIQKKQRHPSPDLEALLRGGPRRFTS